MHNAIIYAGDLCRACNYEIIAIATAAALVATLVALVLFWALVALVETVSGSED